MAWVLLLLENEGQDKRVESILVPCLDAGSNPAISTKKIVLYIQACLRVKNCFFCTGCRRQTGGITKKSRYLHKIALNYLIIKTFVKFIF